jgi:hypothetical protein
MVLSRILKGVFYSSSVEGVDYETQTTSGLINGKESSNIIMSGSLTAAFPVQAGNSFRATFDHLGSVSARFAA